MNNEALIKALRHCGRDDVISVSCLPCDYYGRKPYCEGVLLNDAADALESAEKRIAELESQLSKEGEWISEKYPLVSCSKCGKTMILADYDNYCPNCGAKMSKQPNDSNVLTIDSNALTEEE